MPFQRPTLKEIDERIRNDIASAVRIPGTQRAAALLRRSVVAVKSRVYAGACHLLYGFLDWLSRQRFVHLMEDEFLDAEGSSLGMNRKGAACARGKIRVAGADGEVILKGRECVHDDGMSYRTTAAAIVADGFATVSITAETAGVAGNLPAGTVLRVLGGDDSEDVEGVVTEDGLYDGCEIESDDLYRERILERKRQPPHGGAWFDYVMWAKEVKGVTRAWCLPMWMGEGTVGVMFLRDNDDDPFPNEEQCRAVWEHIEPLRPVTASEIHVISPERMEIDVSVKLSPDTDDIRAAVMDELADFLYRDGEPDGHLHVSRLSESISIATGEHHHGLIYPVNDIHVPKNAVPVLGRVVFIDNLEG